MAVVLVAAVGRTTLAVVDVVAGAPVVAADAAVVVVTAGVVVDAVADVVDVLVIDVAVAALVVLLDVVETVTRKMPLLPDIVNGAATATRADTPRIAREPGGSRKNAAHVLPCTLAAPSVRDVPRVAAAPAYSFFSEMFAPPVSDAPSRPGSPFWRAPRSSSLS